MAQPTETTPFDPTARFPAGIWNQVTGLDARLLDELAHLSRCQATKSPTGATYCVPGRKYLAQKLACSVTTISRRTSRLGRLGLLLKTQRRPHSGRWQTCLYRLIHPAAWAIARLRHILTTTTSRVSSLTHLASSKKRSRQQESQERTFNDLIQRWKARGQGT